MGLSIKIKIILFTIVLVLVASGMVGYSIGRLNRNPAKDPAYSSAWKESLAMMSATFLLAFGAVVLFSLHVIGPVDELIIGTQLVSQGRLDHKIRKKSNDEIGRLVDSFNSMTANLKRSMDERTRFSDIASVEKHKAELIIDSMADSVIVTDSQHNIVLFNPAAERLFDRDETKLLGKHIVNLLKHHKMEMLFEDFPEIKDKMLPVRKAETKITELRPTRPAGKVLKANIAPLINESNMIIGTVVVIEDITKLKELDEMKSDFVSTVSHELRTPLTSIKGYAALMADLKMGPLNEQQKKSVDIINKESDRLADLINDILDLSKLETGKAKTVFTLTDIRDCVDECIMIGVARNKGISVSRLIPDSMPKVLMDKAKIVQVFNNLMSNAVKFTKPGGKITIKGTNRAGYIQVDITDTGIGIPKREISNLFNRFYQVESHLTRNQGGTGLGLAIVKEIIGLHYGLLSVRSRVHKGTTVSFALPKHPLTEQELKKCWEERNCRKVKCPAYQAADRRCWLYMGTHCKKSTNEPCLDKIEICRHCDLYRHHMEGNDERQETDTDSR